MPRFKCTACQKTLQVDDEFAGKKARCPCGNQQIVPTAAVTATAVQASSPRPSAPTHIVVACDCGKKLRVASSAVGKAVRCPCGKTLAVRGDGAAPVVATAYQPAPSNWLNDLPPPPPERPVMVGPIGDPTFWHVDAPVVDEPATPSNPYAPVPNEKSMAGSYLQQAENEVRQRRHINNGSLNSARWILVIVGLLTIGANTFLLMNAQNEVDQVVQQGDVAVSAASILMFTRIFYSVFIFMGVVFIGLGALVYQFPLLCPLAGLIFYILGILVTAALDPFSLVRGIIFKILIVGALAKAISEGAQYRR